MTIIAERGLFVRLLVQSGKFESAAAEALADSRDATSKDPATRLDVLDVKADVALLRQDFGQLRGDMNAHAALHAQRLDAVQDRLPVRLGGVVLALCGLLFAALRLT